tara:strand:+ start:1307 stop:1555 length:249 start_codon:yes stop_codon:yes gene_type:complete
MKILSDATALATGTTKFTSATAVWVSNTASSASDVTLRNAADDADLGSLSVPPLDGVVIHMIAGQGLRGAATLKATQINNGD